MNIIVIIIIIIIIFVYTSIIQRQQIVVWQSSLAEELSRISDIQHGRINGRLHQPVIEGLM